jgi:hypothetical protein
MPLRPLFFTKPTDPTAETIDLILSPAYIVGRVLPPMGDFESTIFFVAAIVFNAILYGVLAHYVSNRISSSPTRL